MTTSNSCADDLVEVETERLRAIVEADGQVLWKHDAVAGWRCRWSQATDTIQD